jgi:hypothetical protein
MCVGLEARQSFRFWYIMFGEKSLFKALCEYFFCAQQIKLRE